MRRSDVLTALLSVTVACLAVGAPALAAPDLFMQDTPIDTGVEPDTTGIMWASPDIHVQQDPIPGYSPQPFTTTPPWWPPSGAPEAEFRPTAYGRPNYIYVQVHNPAVNPNTHQATSASTGTERLRVYWAKASTGLGWPAQWGGDGVDYQPSGTTVYGAEATKPRKNAATASPDERDAYREAIVDIATDPALVYPDGTSYWHKQNDLHANGPFNRHGSFAFLPWHREFLNRYEALLRQADPTVKLLYWDWTTDPASLFTPAFMGARTGPIGAPFAALGPVSRGFPFSGPPGEPDATVLGVAPFEPFAQRVESPSHNAAHGYIGGDMGSIGTAARDPFFFLLHGNADRLWAAWQRQDAARVDEATAYGTAQMDPNLTMMLGPWDGDPAHTQNGGIEPWVGTAAEVTAKASTDPSVVSPPIYDTAPLVIPVLQPGESAVLQIPWYPPDPADYPGPDQGHFCLLARIETAPGPGFGMTVGEGSDVNANTSNNNNVAWRNIQVLDQFGPATPQAATALVRNPADQDVDAGLRFGDDGFAQFGTITVDLGPELFERWRSGGSAGQGIEPAGGTAIRVASREAGIRGLRLAPKEAFPVAVRFDLAKDYPSPQGAVPTVDVIQLGRPGNPNAVVGAQRFELDFNKLSLVAKGGRWRYLADGSAAAADWRSPGFDDSQWREGEAPLGFGDAPATTLESGHVTSYFRRTFEVADPSLLRTLSLRLRRNDGAVVYVNGSEVARVNLPAGAIGAQTRATRAVEGLERQMYFPVAVPPGLVRAGANSVAVEVHLAAPDSPDLSFDLELFANPVTTRYAPDVAFQAPANGTLIQAGDPIAIKAEARDSDGEARSVSFYAGETLLGTDESAPFGIEWRGAPLGVHRLRAVARDGDGLQGEVETTVRVLENTPPSVSLVKPGDGVAVQPGADLAALASASDPGGAVRRVEFHVRRMELFSDPDELAGTVTAAPYATTLRIPSPGMYMVSAVAVDDDGLSSGSLPAMVMVDGDPPVTTATLSPTQTLTLTADDGDGSGVEMIEYSLDGGPFLVYSGPLSGFASGVHAVRFRATDMAGNVEADKRIEFGATRAGGNVTGTVPATLALTLGPPAQFGAFTPGVARDYTASTSANVISTAGDAALTVGSPAVMANGAFALSEPLQVTFSRATWAAPVSNDPVTITFKQHVSATQPLRTGTYATTLTFTLSTTTP